MPAQRSGLAHRLPDLAGTLLSALALLLGAIGCRQEASSAEGKGGGRSETAPVYVCQGFAAPLTNKPMEIGRGRSLPMKTLVMDAAGKPLDAKSLTPAPRVCLTDQSPGGDATDRSDLAAAGDFGKGRDFVYRESYWKFDLATDDLPLGGPYVAELVSADESVYRIDPRCSLTFTVK